jgi:single-stranded-DNA-specific exonuclease
VLLVDAEVPLEQVHGLYAILSEVEPCGQKNPAPVLASRRVMVRQVRLSGVNGQHLKLDLGRPPEASWPAILYRGGHLLGEVPVPGPIDVAYCLRVNDWNGEPHLELEVQDLQASP